MLELATASDCVWHSKQNEKEFKGLEGLKGFKGPKELRN